jgi:Tol biopolymer transport system component
MMREVDDGRAGVNLRAVWSAVPLLVFLIALLALTAPALASFPGQNGRIAFATVTDNGGSLGIHTIRPDGTGRATLRASGSDPAWSADGSKVAFVDGSDPFARRLYTMAADGSNPVQITGSADGPPIEYDEQNPAWSPNAQNFVFQEFYSFTYDYIHLVVVNADGSDRHYTRDNIFDFDPAWSPNGQLIAFSTFNADTPAPHAGIVYDTDIETIRPDGTGGSALTNTDYPTNESEPNWSPDGQKIAFTRRPNIYVMNADGSNQTLVAQNASQPAWSPDGAKIAFNRYQDGDEDIWVMNADGTSQTNMTNSPATAERGPDWQPLVLDHNGYARPKSATPTTIKFVPAFNVCTTGSQSTHGAPLALPSCDPPRQSSLFLTMGTADSNGGASQFVGRLQMRVVCNPPAPGATPPCSDPGDQADVKLDADFSDVRTVTDLTDYFGELNVTLPLRITDRLNGAASNAPGTVSDTSLSFAVPCSGDLDTSVGSSCVVSTTAEAVIPGVVPESKRSVWGLGQVEVFDGGADGVASTPDNTLFAVQGLFAP